MMDLENHEPHAQLIDATFLDVDQLCAAVRSWDIDFRALSMQRNTNVGRITQFSANNIDHAYARFWVSLDQAGAPPPNKITFTILSSQTKHLWWRGHQVNGNQVLVFWEGSTLHSQSGPDFETHVVSVTPDMLAALCDQYEIPVPTFASIGEVFRPRPEVLHYARTRLDYFRNAGGMQADYLDVILQLLKCWDEQRRGDARNQSFCGENNKARAMRRCLEVLTQQDIANITTDMLRAHCGVSARTLEYAFYERYKIGPAAFIKAMKLRRAREHLLNPERSTVSVSDAMYVSGFWHVGQFARDYRAAFGENPSGTYKRVHVNI